MKIRADIAELLHDGLPNERIAARLRVDRKKVAATRAALRLPKTPPGGRARPLPDLLAERSQPVDGGHMRWTGYVNPSGCPVLNYQDQGPRSAFRLVFLVRHGREPVGKAKAGCGYPGCVQPDHIDDQPMRERNRQTLAAIFGPTL
jgi:hypothetical protein